MFRDLFMPLVCNTESAVRALRQYVFQQWPQNVCMINVNIPVACRSLQKINVNVQWRAAVHMK